MSRHHAHADERRAPSIDAQLSGTMFAPETAPAPVVHRVPVSAHMRTVDGTPKPDGETRRNAALDEHERQSAKRAAIVYVRARLLTLYRTRLSSNPNASVNADDVDEVLRQWPQYPAELRSMPGHWKGAVFRGGGWEQTGASQPSSRPRMHATPLPSWRPVGVR